MKVFITLFFAIQLLIATTASAKCINIFYDQAKNHQEEYHFGKIHSIFLQNLLGHFPNVQQIVTPIQSYKSGQIEECGTAIYLGTYFENDVPKQFYSDFIATKKNVLWAGYNVWRFEEAQLEKLWGVKFEGLTSLDRKNKDARGHPSFFRFHEYKGQTFTKYAEWDRKDPSQYRAAFEIARMKLLSPQAQSNVVAWTSHSYTGEKIPYILRNKNHWFIGESPFSFSFEEGRYLIMADILFDLLDEAPRYQQKKPALIRIEDIHARLPKWQLYKMVDTLHNLKVPFSMTVIPVYSDPFGIRSHDPADRMVPMTSDPAFIEFLKYASERGASLIMHGVTHQFGKMRNPFNGLSGDDFEFWDRPQNAPVGPDGAKFVVDRLEDGLSLMNRGGFTPVAWLTPHYQASPLDYVIFSQLFTWNVGRIIYFPTQVTQKNRLPRKLAFDQSSKADNGRRLPFFEDLKVTYPTGLAPNGQFFPYEIYGDHYNQRLIPEAIGNVQPFLNEQVYKTQTVDDLIANIKRNSHLRDNWASFFVHLFSLNNTNNEGIGVYPGDTRELERLVRETEKSGYEFIDLKTWIDSAPLEKRPNPIYRK